MRGRPAFFWAAFALVVGSGVALAFSVRSFFDSLTPLWVSVGLSAAALILAVLSVTLPGRGHE